MEVGDYDGIDFKLELNALGGTSPTFYMKVQTSVDGDHWEDVEGVVEGLGVTRAVVRRLDLQQWVRVVHKLGGTNPTASFALWASWIEDASYPEITAEFDTDPITAPADAEFSGATGIAGAHVEWSIYWHTTDSTDEGSVTAGPAGNWSTTCSTPVDATQADLTVNALGNEASDIANVT